MRSHRTVSFVALAVAILALLMTVAPDFGATWDEPQQRAKALRLLDYLAGRTAVLHEPIDGAHLYGAPFDVVAAALEPMVHADPYVIRHEVIAVVGWLGVVLCGLLADRMFGAPHGILTMGLLAASPFYIAHAVNNPKDLPFATVTTAVLLALTRLRKTAPVLNWSNALAFAALIGLGLNVRPGALLFVGYIGVVVAYRLSQSPTTSLRVAGRECAWLGVILGVALSVGWIAWPWAYDHPIRAPFQAMSELGHFGWSGTVLFHGMDVRGTKVPWDYVPEWFWLVTSPVVLVGLALSVRLFFEESKREQAIALWGATLFPVVFVMGTHATLYDGVRHLLFVVPTMTILAGAGWIEAVRAARSPARLLVAGLFVLGIAEPLVFQWRNHPNQAAYIQPLAGGPRAGFAEYDLDYWGNCLLAGLADVRDRAPAARVYVTGWPLLILEADLSRFPNLTLVGPQDPRASYAVILARGSRERLLSLAADPNVFARITTADGAMLCAVSAPAPDGQHRFPSAEAN